MKNLLRQSLPLILVQALCLAVGLWTQQRYVMATLRAGIEEETWTELSDAARRVVEAPAADSAIGDRVHEPDQPQLQAQFAEVTPAVQVFLLDDPPGVPGPLHDPGAADAARSDGQVRWLARPDGDSRSAIEQGFAEVGGETHVGVRARLRSGRTLIAIQPEAEVEAQLGSRAASLSAVSLITFLWNVAVLSVAALLVLGRLHDLMEQRSSRVTSDVLRQAHNLVRTRDAVIFGLAKLAESRDGHTGEHLDRISAYVTALATALRRDPRFEAEVTPTFVRLIGNCAALHDIGKVGVADDVLLKSGPLLPGEREAMQTHTLIGARCLQEIEQRLGGSNFLQMAREITLGHHERWDGSGYPRGLRGREIPLAARIAAVADVYDALSSQRVYKDALPHDECVRVIRAESGRQFDPDIIEVWLTIAPRFREIAQSLRAGRAGPAEATRFVPERPAAAGGRALPGGHGPSPGTAEPADAAQECEIDAAS